MTCDEFSNAFDTLLNSYNIQASFGEGANKQGGITLDEYEKSVLLTQAQDAIVKSYFDKTLNAQGQGIDDSTRRQVDFSSLIKVAKYSSGTSGVLQHVDDTCYDDRGLILNLDKDKKILFILNEKLEVTESDDSKKVYVVVPINYREYDREMSKAYAQPLKKQVWRLFSNSSTGFDISSEIIPIYGTTGTHKELRYVIRYVKRPTPIILRALPDGLAIDEESAKTECSLNPILHMDILNKAFELAVTTRGGGTAQTSSNRQQEQ